MATTGKEALAQRQKAQQTQKQTFDKEYADTLARANEISKQRQLDEIKKQQAAYLALASDPSTPYFWARRAAGMADDYQTQLGLIENGDLSVPGYLRVGEDSGPARARNMATPEYKRATLQTAIARGNPNNPEGLTGEDYMGATPPVTASDGIGPPAYVNNGMPLYGGNHVTDAAKVNPGALPLFRAPSGINYYHDPATNQYVPLGDPNGGYSNLISGYIEEPGQGQGGSGGAAQAAPAQRLVPQAPQGPVKRDYGPNQTVPSSQVNQDGYNIYRTQQGTIPLAPINGESGGGQSYSGDGRQTYGGYRPRYSLAQSRSNDEYDAMMDARAGQYLPQANAYRLNQAMNDPNNIAEAQELAERTNISLESALRAVVTNKAIEQGNYAVGYDNYMTNVVPSITKDAQGNFVFSANNGIGTPGVINPATGAPVSSNGISGLSAPNKDGIVYINFNGNLVPVKASSVSGSIATLNSKDPAATDVATKAAVSKAASDAALAWRKLDQMGQLNQVKVMKMLAGLSIDKQKVINGRIQAKAAMLKAKYGDPSAAAGAGGTVSDLNIGAPDMTEAAKEAIKESLEEGTITPEDLGIGNGG